MDHLCFHFNIPNNRLIDYSRCMIRIHIQNTRQLLPNEVETKDIIDYVYNETIPKKYRNKAWRRIRKYKKKTQKIYKRLIETLPIPTDVIKHTIIPQLRYPMKKRTPIRN